ncbi:MAG: cupin domain-containing protein [Saprospiraceae bacterium]|nr:cupin domain-containing protein [Saprospiraceae bacterium]
MKGFTHNIQMDTLENTYFRKVLYTGKHLQLVVMNIKVGEDSGEEIFQGSDHFVCIECGVGKCIIEGHEYVVGEGDVVLIPAGSKHIIVNTHPTWELQFYTIYGPPTHKDGIVRKTKADALRSEE